MVRLVLALPLAAGLAFGLFLAMAWMVTDGAQQVQAPRHNPRVNMYMVEREQEVQRRQRSLPEKPQLPQMPQASPPTEQQKQSVSVNPLIAANSLDLDTGIEALTISAPSFGEINVDQQAMPIHRVEPTYPAKALKRKMEGYVTLRFTIDVSGRPSQIEVVDAKPKRVFDKAALYAVKKWKYQPQLIDGKAVEQPNQTVTVEFKLAQ
ncbi:energy transducer TonB [Vibrio sp.]|uniref:energy transducer TonB n=1 Tax=Vibrio sp. TaxID=678 RepID=UPI003D14CA17